MVKGSCLSVLEVVVVVVAVGSVLMAVTPVTASDNSASCCTPEKFQGRQLLAFLRTGLKGTYMLSMEMEVTYDAENSREVYKVNKTDSKGVSEQFVLYSFYDDSAAYKYDVKKGTCTVLSLGTFHPRCIPETSKVLDDDVTLGGGSNELTAKRVYYMSPSASGITHGQAYVTEDCYPIFETRQISNFGVLQITSNIFEDVEEGIESEDVFTLPKACSSLVTKRSADGETLDMSDFFRIPEAIEP